MSWDESKDGFSEMETVPRRCMTSVMGTCRKASDLGKGTPEQTWIVKVSQIHPRIEWMPDALLLQAVWATEVGWTQQMSKNYIESNPKTQRHRRATMAKKQAGK